MPNKPNAAWVVFALAVLGALAAWQYSRLKAPLPPTSQAVASLTLEKALRALMPEAGLLQEDWLKLDDQVWKLRVPRRRDMKALGTFLRDQLKPTMYEWRDGSFYLEMGFEKLLAVQSHGPALAFVIDDWGYHTRVLDVMINFPARLTVAVIPGLPHSRECAEAAFGAGHEVILHLPMEPERKMPLTKGTLMVGMPPTEVTAWMDKHALSVPHMVGMNNHEGSKGSADAALMRCVCGWLKEHDDYFLDSKTSAKSVGEREASKAGIPHAARRVFLDNLDQPKAIEKAAREALALAKQNGFCIAIGHPRENTLAVLTRLAPEFLAAGVDLVGASELTQFEIQPHVP